MYSIKELLAIAKEISVTEQQITSLHNCLKQQAVQDEQQERRNGSSQFLNQSYSL